MEYVNTAVEELFGDPVRKAEKEGSSDGHHAAAFAQAQAFGRLIQYLVDNQIVGHVDAYKIICGE